MPLKLLTAATAAAVSLAEAKAHLRIDDTADDALIAALVAAATDAAEHLMGRAVMPQTWALTLDEFPGSTCKIRLDRPPVASVTSVRYIDAAGAQIVLPDNKYQLLTGSDYRSDIVPSWNASWPTARAQPEAVQVLFIAGYANATAVPELIKAWIKLRLGALYEHREAWTAGKPIEPNAHVDGLLDRYRVWSF